MIDDARFLSLFTPTPTELPELPQAEAGTTPVDWKVLGPGIRAIRAVIEAEQSPALSLAPTDGEAIAMPVPAAQIEAEVAALDADQILHTRDTVTVFVARGGELPGVLMELGRLRELAFRAAGEGTGRARDLDRWDLEYEHIVAWDGEARELLGAYRLGRVDEALRRRGPAGMYLASLFTFAPDLWDEVGPALEMGRAFVAPGRQRSALALSDLWQGIGSWLVRNPEYRMLLGAVSIDNQYSPLSLHLMVGHLRGRHSASRLVNHVLPHNPLPAITDLDRSLRSCGAALPHLRMLNEVVERVEPDGRGIPVLFRSYMGLGARVLGVNVDPDFQNSIDALVVVDLDGTDPRRLRRFMGRQGLTEWQRFAPRANEAVQGGAGVTDP